ncbi:MAG: ABC transporter ATP-binding protein [Pseudomonadota bacterium]
MSNVTLTNLIKRYGDVTAVDNISLEIEEGEFFSILGPSGCGKSTTLRMIAGFEDISAGEIALDGKDVSGLPPEQRNIGFVFQNYAIFPHMNVMENIAFGLRLRKLPESEIRRRVAAALDQVGMSGLEARMQSEMSGGQQQRVALARVLVTEPKILLLDEPLSALDKNLREEMKFWIKDLQVSLGITTIYVTHDQGEALTMSDRIAVMNQGQVAQIGSPREIYETPEDLFVAQFIGESSVLAADVTGVGTPVGQVDVAGLSFTARVHPKLKAGQKARLLLRPEHVSISLPDQRDGWNTAPAKVTAIAYQGATLRFTLEMGGGRLLSEFPNGPDAPRVDIGQSVDVAWRRDAALALPLETQ